MISPFMEARIPCNTGYDWQHVTSLARSNKKLGILSVMNNMHSISIVGEANGDIAVTSDNVEKRAVILKIDAAKRRLDLRLVLRQRPRLLRAALLRRAALVGALRRVALASARRARR